jgi:hypothetical protein
MRGCAAGRRRQTRAYHGYERSRADVPGAAPHLWERRFEGAGGVDWPARAGVACDWAGRRLFRRHGVLGGRILARL